MSQSKTADFQCNMSNLVERNIPYRNKKIKFKDNLS